MVKKICEVCGKDFICERLSKKSCSKICTKKLKSEYDKQLYIMGGRKRYFTLERGLESKLQFMENLFQISASNLMNKLVKEGLKSNRRIK